jgi:hypothetical protein
VRHQRSAPSCATDYALRRVPPDEARQHARLRTAPTAHIRSTSTARRLNTQPFRQSRGRDRHLGCRPRPSHSNSPTRRGSWRSFLSSPARGRSPDRLAGNQSHPAQLVYEDRHSAVIRGPLVVDELEGLHGFVQRRCRRGDGADPGRSGYGGTAAGRPQSAGSRRA